MGILKISEEIHEEIRKASDVMSRSINAQAEFWMKIGMYAESNPEMNFNQIISLLLQEQQVYAASAFKGGEKPCSRPTKTKLAS